MNIQIHHPSTPAPKLDYKDFPATEHRPSFSVVELSQGDDTVTIFLPYLHRLGQPDEKAEA